MILPDDIKLSKPEIIDVYNKKQGYWYVYSNRHYWNKEKGQTRHIRQTIGKRLTKDGEIIYNNKYKAEHAAEAVQNREISKTQLLGEVLVLDQAVKDLGIRKHLVKAFGKSTADYILGIAQYTICTEKAMSWCGDWAEGRCRKIEGMASQSVSSLLSSLSGDKMRTFYRLWMEANHCKRGYFCFDSTNIKGYNTETNPLVEYGYTHGHIRLPQTNLAILSRQDTLVPIFSLIYNGSKHDSKTLEELLRELNKLDLKNICLTLDKGYYSENNIELIISNGNKFIMPIPKRVNWQYPIIDELKDALYSLSSCMEVEDGKGEIRSIQCATKLIKRKGHRFYVHVVYDAAKRAKAETGFIALLAQCKRELEENRCIQEHERIYKDFFTVKDTPKRGRRVLEKTQSIAEFQKSYAGYWCLLTNQKKDRAEIYQAYQGRNVSEMFFDDTKNELNGDSITCKTLAAYKGKMFVLFIALAILVRVKANLKEAKKRNMIVRNRLKTYKQLLFRMSTMAKVSSTGKYKPIYSNPTKLQEEIIKELGLDWPGNS